MQMISEVGAENNSTTVLMIPSDFVTWHGKTSRRPTSAPAALKVDPSTGLLVNARQVLSPHFDARPSGVLPSLIVVHGITLPPDEFGGPWVDRLFTGDLPPDAHPFFKGLEGARMSAHAFIRREGVITQYVPFGQRAWHAGKSDTRDAVPATISRSASSSRGPIRWPTPMRSTHPSPR